MLTLYAESLLHTCEELLAPPAQSHALHSTQMPADRILEWNGIEGSNMRDHLIPFMTYKLVTSIAF